MSTEPCITLDSISFDYPGRPVLEGINFHVHCGEAIAILGRNGTGKTTLLHLVLGWLEPRSGSVRLDGRSLSGYTRRHLGRTLSLVPQAELVSFDYTVLEYVLLGRAPHLTSTEAPGSRDIAVAEEAIRRVGIEDLRSRSAARLSGGELQLVLLARSLAQDPRLLLLDEPSSHLDISNKARLLSLLRRLKADGVSLLFSTHDPDFAAALADRVILVHDRRVLAVGTPEETLTQEYLTEVYEVPVTVRRVAGSLCLRWHDQPDSDENR